jgi:polyphenol oxidase
LSRWRNSGGLYFAPGLASLPGIEHGFGTRTSPAPPARVLKQIHSDVIYEAGASCDSNEGDGLFTAEPGQWIAVKTADCVPILLADRQARAVAAVHAGWRGTRAGIAAQVVERLRETLGIAPAELHAAIGPSIGPCCYEVGEEVATCFASAHVDAAGARPRLDLWSANRAALEAAGVPGRQIETAGLCTCCGAEEFHSWRRDGAQAGRMSSCIRLAPR